jgi:hypothetical protein
MSLELEGESIEIIDAHTHMGERKRREGRTHFNSFSGDVKYLLLDTRLEYQAMQPIIKLMEESLAEAKKK